MIPKTIHYCWFGGKPLPKLALRCIKSWKKFCPDYTIKEWNEKNFDVHYNEYAKQAYEAKKWAFVSDVARLYIIYTEGGIYLDTDVEIIRPLDPLLTDHMFAGFENDKYVNTGLGFGAERHHDHVRRMLEIYGDLSFIKPDGGLDTTPCPQYNTQAMAQAGFVMNNTKQTQDCATLYPGEYFCPKDYETKKLKITENTYSIHHFDASWMPAYKKIWFSLVHKVWLFRVIDQLRVKMR